LLYLPANPADRHKRTAQRTTLLVKLFVSNTDLHWFDFLAGIDGIEEANFWQPSAKKFHAVSPGEFFVFRLKSPRDCIGGFGVLSNSTILPIQMAWDTFGTSNGVSSLQDFVTKIQRYRVDIHVTPQTLIGCRILVQPIFLTEKQWRPLPSSWSRNIVGGKSYNTADMEGRLLWEELNSILEDGSSVGGISEPATRYGDPGLIRPRLGQGSFRVSIIEAYNRHCALSHGKVLPALEAAHIRPYSLGGKHKNSNGILLRKDIHSVFDAGYATFDKDYRFVVSDRVKEIFDNGNEYRSLHGRKLILPNDEIDWPDIQAIRWHTENCFEK
jgi:putative restriction endonuclease